MTAATYTSALKKDALKGARLGVLRQIFTAEVTDSRVIAHFQGTLAELKAAGAEIVDAFIIPDLDSLPRPILNPPARFKDDLSTMQPPIGAHRFCRAKSYARAACG